ncbi:PREDICTED: uncharacterized protein LOC108372381 [Rhagoletis zephyria]|nr:PREDICTED: uncharacterized protein LOC108372381 [Rhagoletis zephyria]XP_036342843.1 uncharacterized protein LOC118752102 [Rhagoletis pomonella]
MDFMRDFVAPRKTFSNLDFTSQEEEINGISPCNVTETSYYEEYEVSSPLPSVPANDTEQSNSAKKNKRRRVEDEANERFGSLCVAVNEFVGSKSESFNNSRNFEFYKVLDSYVLKHPEQAQSKL